MKNISLIEIIIIIAIIALISAVFYGSYQKEHVEMPNAFAAWEKQTGNPKELTYEEWRSLMKANEKQDDSIIIINH